MKIGTVARKFLFSKKSHSIVNLVAIVSVVAIAVPTTAMIITLSLHNGLTSLIHNLYSGFDSELRVTPSQGQYFEITSDELRSIEEFADVAPTLDCNAILKWGERSTVVTLRGVDSTFRGISNLPSTIKRGCWTTLNGESPRLVLGAGVSYNLALSLGMGKMVDLYTLLPNNLMFKSLGMATISSKRIEPAGVFTAETTIDSKYVFTDLGFVRELIQQPTQFSSLELKPRVGIKEARRRISEILGTRALVQDQREQRQVIFSTVEAEKVMLYFTLLLISLIAAMSLAGCTLMMITEKAQASVVLRSLGMTQRAVKGLFVHLSMQVVLLGSVIGLILGVGFVAVQYYLKPFKMAGYQLVVESYPVELSLTDILVTLSSVLVISFLIIRLTVGAQSFNLLDKK